MTPAQFDVLDRLFNSGFKPVIWGSDNAGWRVGPYSVPGRVKRVLEQRGWIRPETSRIEEGQVTDRLVWTEEGRRAFIAAGGHPGAHGGRKARQRQRRSG